MILSELCKEANYVDKSGILFNGDCLEIMKDIDDNSIDCIICDLPYGTTKCSWDVVLPFKELWEQYNRIIKQKGAIVLFGQEPFSSVLRCSNLKMYRYDWKWKKQKPSNFQLMGYQCGRVTEDIMIFSKAKSCYVKNGNNMNYFPQLVKREKIRKANAKIYGDTSKNILHDYKTIDNYKVYEYKQPINIIEFNTVSKNKLHTTQKPIELIEYLINTYSNENDIVLDNCMGSGTTCVSAKQLGRKYIGIELDENYFNIAKERISSIKIMKEFVEVE